MHLSEVAPMIRKGIAITIVFIISYVLITSVALPILQGTFATLFPGKDAPTVKFGMLDPLQFVEKPITNENPQYILNTKNGGLPALTNQLPVYKIKPAGFSYADGKNAQTDASFLGFAETDLITDLKGSTYRWKSTISSGILEVAIHSKELTLKTPLEGKGGIFGRGGMNEQSASLQAKGLFKALNRFNDKSYENGAQVVYFGKFIGNRLVQSDSLSTSQMARVEVYRKFGQYPVYGPDPKKGHLRVYIASPSARPAPVYIYPLIEAYYREYEPVVDATYPLISVSQAWNAVKRGNGVISNVTPNGLSPFEEYTPVQVDRIYINNIYIAYYEAIKDPVYVQPIYVFEGNYATDNGTKGTISIYYPAVSGKWVKSNPAPTQNSAKSN